MAMAGRKPTHTFSDWELAEMLRARLNGARWIDLDGRYGCSYRTCQRALEREWKKRKEQGCNH